MGIPPKESPPAGVLATTAGQAFPLEVCQSTADAPCTRESCEYWQGPASAQRALARRALTQRHGPCARFSVDSCSFFLALGRRPDPAFEVPAACPLRRRGRSRALGFAPCSLPRAPSGPLVQLARGPLSDRQDPPAG